MSAALCLAGSAEAADALADAVATGDCDGAAEAELAAGLVTVLVSGLGAERDAGAAAEGAAWFVEDPEHAEIRAAVATPTTAGSVIRRRVLMALDLTRRRYETPAKGVRNR